MLSSKSKKNGIWSKIDQLNAVDSAGALPGKGGYARFLGNRTPGLLSPSGLKKSSRTFPFYIIGVPVAVVVLQVFHAVCTVELPSTITMVVPLYCSISYCNRATVQ